MKIYITQYALTQGVIECEGEEKNLKPNGAIFVKPPGWYGATLFTKDQFTFSIEDAKNRFEEMRIKKIESLNRQIIQAESKTFKMSK